MVEYFFICLKVFSVNWVFMFFAHLIHSFKLMFNNKDTTFPLICSRLLKDRRPPETGVQGPLLSHDSLFLSHMGLRPQHYCLFPRKSTFMVSSYLTPLPQSHVCSPIPPLSGALFSVKSQWVRQSFRVQLNSTCLGCLSFSLFRHCAWLVGS